MSSQFPDIAPEHESIESAVAFVGHKVWFGANRGSIKVAGVEVPPREPLMLQGESGTTAVHTRMSLERSERVYRAVKRVDTYRRVSMSMCRDRSVGYNCTVFAHDLAGVPVSGCENYGSPQDWQFEPAPVEALVDGDTGIFMYHEFDPAQKEQSLGHWFTMLTETSSTLGNLALHVNGGDHEPILLSPMDRLLRMYPPEKFQPYRAIPPAS